MPEQRTAGISADSATQKRPSQQRPFGHPPRPNSMNVHKLTSANRPRALGRVRMVGMFM
jgi:hypothetical protein